ncbi:polysaccharide deacetylase family protein [Arenimonas composti]|uniref:DUF7033 domain-containing protein n=1 Tax=Arenimonas composti TR7-09 = DSM 18010 TaxID=1121013 RepID=A0A091BAW7_9GAMM|nr:hypothetical protein [Arenimonas composti]KFN48876.1 hypothetical protein P873_13060 [Arenimonas composti TR7-09 = DSM 18010]
MAALTVRIPASAAAERRYAFAVLLRERLGLEVEVVVDDGALARVSMPGETRELSFAEGFFARADADWLGEASLPPTPLPRLPVPEWLGLPAFVPSALVAPWGPADGAAVEETTAGLHVRFDLPGAAFFLLSRYEEGVPGPGRRDEHDRFPAQASLLYSEGVLERPLVDEYVECLWACLRRLWPALVRKPRSYRFFVSHDVDNPLFALGLTPRRLASALAGDVLSRRDPGLAWRRLRSSLTGARNHYAGDPFDTFDFIMGESEKRGLCSAFYFITGGDTRRDADYTMAHPWVRGLVKRIGERGHEVGLHPSFATYLDPEETARQFRTLVDAARECGVEQACWGGRQHFLRWCAGTTWANWDAAGLDYDSSVCFADHPGFRAGTCHEYPVYDIVGRRALRLRERPLVLMETTLMSPQYMALPAAKRPEIVRRLAATCHAYSGDMTLLWHNSKMLTRDARREYLDALDICLAAGRPA